MLKTHSTALICSEFTRLRASHSADPGRGHGEHVKQQRRDDREQHIGPRPGQRDQDRVAPRVVQTSEIDRHRLRVSEQKTGCHKKQRRQDDGAERIDMLQRVESDAALAPGRVVARSDARQSRAPPRETLSAKMTGRTQVVASRSMPAHCAVAFMRSLILRSSRLPSARQNAARPRARRNPARRLRRNASARAMRACA